MVVLSLGDAPVYPAYARVPGVDGGGATVVRVGLTPWGGWNLTITNTELSGLPGQAPGATDRYPAAQGVSMSGGTPGARRRNSCSTGAESVISRTCVKTPHMAQRIGVQIVILTLITYVACLSGLAGVKRLGQPARSPLPGM